MKKAVLFAATAVAVLVAGAFLVACTGEKTNVRQITTTIPSQIAPPQAGGDGTSAPNDEAGDDRSDERGDNEAGDARSDERSDDQSDERDGD
jgi:hypothetical protein